MLVNAWPSSVEVSVLIADRCLDSITETDCAEIPAASQGSEGTLLTPVVTASYPRKPPLTALPTTPRSDGS